MLRLEGIKLPVGCGEAVLREKVLQRLRLRNAGDLLSLTLLRRSIDAALQDLGQLLYDTHTGHPRDSEVLLAKMEEIDGLKSRLRALERQRRPACPACPACGGPCAPEDLFCRHCGGKLS